MQAFRDIPIRRKLTVIILVTASIALLLASAGFIAYDQFSVRREMTRDLRTVAEIVGANSAAALLFNDQIAATETLSALSAKSHIVCACIYSSDGVPFAKYMRGRPNGDFAPPEVEDDGSHFSNDRLILFKTIVLDQERIGTLYIQSDLEELQSRISSHTTIVAVLLIASLIVAFLVSTNLQRVISQPISELARTARAVSNDKDYSIRAVKRGQDEIGSLIDGFNEMLAQIQSRDVELRTARDELEKRVEDRTRELQEEVDERVRAQEALHESESKFRDLFDNAPVGYHELDTEARFTRVNRTELEMLGYTAEEMIGRPAWEFMESTARETIQHKMTGAMTPAAFELNFIRKDGTTLPVLLEDKLIHDAAGNICGIRTTVVDNTRRKLADAALQKAKQAAENASRAKSEFLANMSHEIRTPMNGIMGMTDLALDTNLSDEQREYLELVKLSADSMTSVINDILDFSKIEAGKLDLDPIDFDLLEISVDTIKTLAIRAEQKGLSVNFCAAPELPSALIGDPGRLRQVLVNLVGNAIKFTEIGRIDVGVSIAERTEQDVLLHFTVCDTGIGVPTDKQGTIFEAFAQADGSTSRQYGGTGLGLTISSQLVSLMGGSIWVESRPGERRESSGTGWARESDGDVCPEKTGSVTVHSDIVDQPSANEGPGSSFHFTARFGLQKCAPFETTRALNPQPRDGRSLRVLVAEDNAVNQKLALRLLEKHGYVASIAENGRRALAALESEPFDLVLMDVQMPEMNGFEATAWIREQEQRTGGHLPIIAITAHAIKGDEERCLAAGMDGYLSKPIRPKDLFETIDRLLLRTSLLADDQSLSENAADRLRSPERLS